MKLGMAPIFKPSLVYFLKNSMKKFEYIIPIDFWAAKNILESEATFLKRSKIDDAYYEGTHDNYARLRKQDSLTRLSCTKKEVIDEIVDAHETVVLDYHATAAMLEMCGFKKLEEIHLTRDSFRKNQYSLSLDRVKGFGDFLVLETEAHELTPERLKLAAERFIGKMEIPLKGHPQELKSRLDSLSFLPYTRAIGIAV